MSDVTYCGQLSEEKQRQVCAIAVRELRQLGIQLPKARLQASVEETTRCFGQPLQRQTMTMIDGIGKVPVVLVTCCTYLDGHLKTEGLFRVEGSKLRQRDLRLRLDRGLPVKDTTPVHDMCSVLKAWLRELPEPLISRGLAKILLQATVERSLEVQVHILRLACLLLPSGQLHALRYLCQFLKRVAAYCQYNRMPAPNLGACLGPSLMKPLEGSTELLGRINRVVALMIDFAQEVGACPSAWAEPSQQLDDSRQRSVSIGRRAVRLVGRAVSRIASRSRSRSPHLQSPAPAAATDDAETTESRRRHRDPLAPASQHAPIADRRTPVIIRQHLRNSSTSPAAKRRRFLMDRLGSVRHRSFFEGSPPPLLAFAMANPSLRGKTRADSSSPSPKLRSRP